MNRIGESRERLCLAALTLLFLLVNLATATRYPMPWVDEIQFADAAINLYLGHGFTSSVWIAQPADAFWAGNTPLYTGLLYLWLKLAGLSIAAVRSLNFVLMSLVVWLVWDLAKRRGFVGSSGYRLVLAVLLFTGHALMFSFRMGRYDVLGMLLFAVAAIAWTGPATPLRLGLLTLTALLAPLAGLQLLPAAVLYCALALVFQGRPAIPRIIATGCGLGTGILLLYAFYASHGVWDAFRASTSAVGVIGQNLAGKIAALPKIYTADKSSLLLLCAALLLAAGSSKGLWRRGPLAFGLVTATLIPTVLQLIAKFPIYYSWMIYGPLAIGVCSTLATASPPVSIRGAAQLLIAGACLVGLPSRLAAVTSQWANRDPASIDRYVASQLVPNDRVVADFKAYYAVKARASALYAPTALGVMSPAERESITVLLIQPKDLDRISTAIGGMWRASGPLAGGGAAPPGLVPRLMREFAEESYPLQLYRRAR